MKEIRLHGRGGLGVVKAAQTIVKAAVAEGRYAQFIPFFGVERKGSPVFGFLRTDDKEIRLKTQIYRPEILFIFDDSLLEMPQTYSGFQDGGTVILNTSKPISALELPKNAKTVALVDATGLAMKALGVNIPNTAMLGAFCRVTGIVRIETMLKFIDENFGGANSEIAKAAYDAVSVHELEVK